MLVDVVCVIALLLFGLMGAWRGLIHQVFSLVALVLILLFAVPAGIKVANLIMAGSEWSAQSAHNLRIGMLVAATAAIYVLVKLLGTVVEKAIGKTTLEDDDVGMATWNRYWGAALGVVTSALVCWLVLCFFMAFPRVSRKAADLAEDSWASNTTRVYNPFDRWMEPGNRADFEDAMLALWKLRRRPGAWEKVGEEESVREILQHKHLTRLLEDDEGKGSVAGMLMDEDFRRTVRRIDWAGVADTANRALAGAEQTEEAE